MHFSGSPVLTTGGVVIGPGESPTLDMPWGPMRVVIKPGSPLVQLIGQTNTLELTGVQADLGAYTALDISLTNGQKRNLRLFLHTVNGGAMLLNYTVT